MNLITGVTGLVGAHIALQLLEQNKPVIALKRVTSDTSKTKKLFSYYTPHYQQLFDAITWVDGDVCDIYSLLEALDGIETVYHCAGFVSFNPKYNKKLYKINSEGTANVVNACLEKKVKTLCHVSSIATLNNPDVSVNINETIYWKSSPQVSDYAISKYNAEREVWRGIEEGLNAIIVNPSIIIGPGFWEQSSGKLIEACYNKTPFYTDGTSATIDARDVAKCMIQLVEKQIINERFILSENNYAFKHIFDIGHELFHHKKPSIKAGKILLRIARFLATTKSILTNTEPIITKETAYSALQKNSFSNQKIKAVIDFDFIPLTETLEFVCKCYVLDKKQ